MARARRQKVAAASAWDVVRSLAARMVRELAVDARALEPLGDFTEIECDAEWAEVLRVVAARAASEAGRWPDTRATRALLVGEAIGDVLQARDDVARAGLAFCQTPGFVAEYLLDHVLLAFDRYGAHNQGRDGRAEDGSDDEDGRTGELDQRIRLLDPACGSGHLLVRAARRIAGILSGGGWRAVDAISACMDRGSDTDSVLAAWAAGVVTGYDLNPQAAALARVRLAAWLLASGPPPSNHFAAREWHAALDRVLAADATDGDAAVQVRDSLLDPGEDRFEMVVANPPYITPKDAAQREAIRAAYTSASGKYGLHGPFIEATLLRWLQPGGFTAQLVSNNFQKREWGRALIEEVIAAGDLRFVTDTSGAFIPGHGTPTCILGLRGFRSPHAERPRGPRAPGGRGGKTGRRGARLAEEPPRVVAVLAGRGEPNTPEDPSRGRVWTAIRGTIGRTLGAMVREPLHR